MEINFFLNGIKETEYKFNYDFDYESFSYENIFFEMEQKSNPDFEKKEIHIITSVTIKYGNDLIDLAKQSVMVSYSVDSIQELVKEENGEFEYTSKDFVFTLVSVAIGTLRGILYKNLRGTKLENVILPLVPRDMIFQKGKSKQ